MKVQTSRKASICFSPILLSPIYRYWTFRSASSIVFVRDQLQRLVNDCNLWFIRQFGLHRLWSETLCAWQRNKWPSIVCRAFEHVWKICLKYILEGNLGQQKGFIKQGSDQTLSFSSFKRNANEKGLLSWFVSIRFDSWKIRSLTRAWRTPKLEPKHIKELN